MDTAKAREEAISRLLRMPEDSLRQVLCYMKALSAEPANEASTGNRRRRLRHILCEAGPELFSDGDTKSLRPAVHELKRQMAI